MISAMFSRGTNYNFSAMLDNKETRRAQYPVDLKDEMKIESGLRED